MGGPAAGSGGTDMTVATRPAQRVAQAPLSYRKNMKMLRGPQLAALRSAYRASMGIGDDRGWQHWAALRLLHEDRGDILDGVVVRLRQELADKTDGEQAGDGEADHDPAQADAGLPGGEHLDEREVGVQSTQAAIAAAWPRTAVGKTSPWSSQPVPPTPIANEAMKKSRPTMMMTSRSVPPRKARPRAAMSADTIMPV